MSAGEGSGLSPSCCVEGIGGRCLLVTAVVFLPPVVSTCTSVIFSSAWFKLTWYPGQTHINTRRYI